jgi:hypothetical protein
MARAATLPLSWCRRIHFTAVLGLTPKTSAASRRDKPPSIAPTTRSRKSRE